MKGHRISNASGFTLIDTLVGVTIFAIASNAMLGMLMFSMLTVRATSLDTHGVALAVQEEEDLRSIVYSAIASRDPYPANAPDVFQGVPFAVHSEVQVDQPAANMKTLTITVSWKYHGRPQSYALQSVYTNING